MDIIECLSDNNLLGRSLVGEPSSWNAWRSFLRAFFGLPLSDTDAALYHESTGRSALPGGPFRKGYLICGRGSGKTFTMSLIAVYLACFRNWTAGLAPGGRPVVLLVAPTREQAKIALDYIVGILDQSPILRQQIWSVTASSVDLTTRVSIEVVSANYRSIRGRAICVCLIDECAFLRQDESASPDVEILNSITPAIGRFGKEGILLIGSTPYAKRGVLYDGFCDYHGKGNSEAICWLSPTATMNPSYDVGLIAKDIEKDPARFRAEYLCEWRNDIEGYISLEILQSCVVPGLREIPPARGVAYHGFVDVSGGGVDSFTMGISHRNDDGTTILDCLREIRPPFSPECVTEEFAAIFKSYGIYTIFGDDYAGSWPKERFSNHGVTYESVGKPRSDIYKEFAPLLRSQKVQLLDNSRMISQIHGLERRVAPGGRDAINHAPNCHDDCANACAGAIVLAAGDSVASLWQKFGEVLSDPPVAGTDLDPATRAALVWRSHRETWRNHIDRLDAQVVAALDAIERDQGAEMKCE